MRKYLIGAIAGAALMFGVQAGASGLLTGSKVAGERDVTVNGKSVGQAAIINNSSYLPVRAVAESLGLGIDLNGGKINLTTTQVDSESAEVRLSLEQIKQNLSDVEAQLTGAQKSYDDTQGVVENASKYPDMADFVEITKKNNEETRKLIDQLEQQKADLEAQLQALQAQQGQ